jgi:mannosyltransferase
MLSSDSRAGRPSGLLQTPAYVLLGLLTTAALAMRLAQAGESLWVDELHTAWAVAGGVDELAARAKAGNQPPLYFYLVRGATRLFGMNEAALRLPSILAGAALVPFSFALVRRWSGSNWAALAAAAIAAVDRDFLFYATEARVYAVLQLLALLRLAVFVRLLAASSGRLRLAYIAVSALMFHLHYTTALLWVGEAACVTLVGCGRRRRNGAPADAADDPGFYAASSFLRDSLVIVALVLPAAPHLAEVFQRRENWAGFIPAPTLEQLATEPYAGRIAPWACYLAPPAVCLLLSILTHRRSHRRDDEPARGLNRVLLVTATWIAVPILAAWLLSVTDIARVFLYRYLIGSAAAAPLVAGLLCGLGATKIWRSIAAIAAISAAIGCTAPEYAARFAAESRFLADRNEDWRSAIAHINSRDDRLPVLLYAGLIETKSYAASPDPLLRAYCVLPATAIYDLGADRRTLLPLTSLGAPLSSEQCQPLTAQQGAWLLLRVPPLQSAAAVRRSVRLAAACGAPMRVVELETFGGVAAARIDLAREDE